MSIPKDYQLIDSKMVTESVTVEKIKMYRICFAHDVTYGDGIKKTFLFDTISPNTLDEYLDNKPVEYRKLTGEERDQLGV